VTPCRSLSALALTRQVRTRACVSEAAERWRAAALAARPASPAAATPALRWLNPHPRAPLCRASYVPSADAAAQPCGAVAFSRSAVGGLEVRVRVLGRVRRQRRLHASKSVRCAWVGWCVLTRCRVCEGPLQVPLCVSCPPHNGGVRVWNLLTGECVHTLHASDVPERIMAVAFSPDGTVRTDAPCRQRQPASLLSAQHHSVVSHFT
jgi:hypothetical protein